MFSVTFVMENGIVFYTDFTDFTEGKRASLMIPVRKYSILGDFNEGRRCF